MKSDDIRPLIEQLSKATSREAQIIIKAFLSGTYKDDYDKVMDIMNRNCIVSKVSSDTIENAVECTKLFNEALSLSQNLSEEQQQEAEKRKVAISQEFRNRCYNYMENHGIKIE